MESCTDVGGVCTEQAWVICPADYEPVESDAPLGCGGHCCVPAPAGFACNESAIVNCVSGSSCDDAPDDCWGSPLGPTLACEPGKVCCNWQCW
jgi:hypothetical protein